MPPLTIELAYPPAAVIHDACAPQVTVGGHVVALRGGMAFNVVVAVLVAAGTLWYAFQR
jgi:hypothetical protein